MAGRQNSQFIRTFVHTLYFFEGQERGYQAAIRFSELGLEAVMPPASRI
jgi:hypothetical protein